MSFQSSDDCTLYPQPKFLATRNAPVYSITCMYLSDLARFGGSLFETRAAATAKARSSTVDSHVGYDRTTSDDDAEQSGMRSSLEVKGPDKLDHRRHRGHYPARTCTYHIQTRLLQLSPPSVFCSVSRMLG